VDLSATWENGLVTYLLSQSVYSFVYELIHTELVLL